MKTLAILTIAAATLFAGDKKKPAIPGPATPGLHLESTGSLIQWPEDMQPAPQSHLLIGDSVSWSVQSVGVPVILLEHTGVLHVQLGGKVHVGSAAPFTIGAASGNDDVVAIERVEISKNGAVFNSWNALLPDLNGVLHVKLGSRIRTGSNDITIKRVEVEQ